MRRIWLPMLWVCAFVLAACTAVAPSLRAGERAPWDLGAPGGATVEVGVQIRQPLKTQQTAPVTGTPMTVGNVATYAFELRRQSDNGVAASFSAGGPKARFVGVPDGTYYLRADALNGSAQSLVQGGPQTSANTVTVASPSVLYSTGGSLTVSLNLLDGQGKILPVHVTAPYVAGFTAVLASSSLAVPPVYSATVSSLEFRNVLDGTYRVWAMAHDGGGIATPALASGFATVSGNATSVSGNLDVVVGGTVSPMGAIGLGDGGQPTAAILESPEALCVTGTGDIVVVEPAQHRVRVIAGTSGSFYGQAMAAGRIYTLAGTGTPGNGGDSGPGRFAQLNSPSGVAADVTGDLYLADTGNHRIRKLSRTTGLITAFAGNPAGGSGAANGSGPGASFNQPKGLAFSGVGDLYVADTGNHRIRRITSGGVVSTAAGSSQGWTDGPAGSSQFNAPEQLTVDTGSNTVYIADTGNHRIRVLTSGGAVTTLAGDGTQGFLNGTGTGARFDTPRGLVLNGPTALYVADKGNHMVRRIDTGTQGVTTWAGTGSVGFSGDGGPQGSAQLNQPSGMAIQGAVLYIADTGNKRLRQVGVTITTLAGNGGVLWAGEDCPMKAARFASVAAVTVDAGGHLLVAEEDTHLVRILANASGTFYGKAMVAGNVYTVAGQAGTAGTANGTGTAAQFNTPTGLSCDTVGNVYVADSANNLIRRIDASGVVTTLVSGLNQPRDVVCSTTAQLYITELGTNQLSKAPATGGTATSVLGVSGPQGLAIDGDGTVYVAASGNHTVAKLLTNGSNQLVAGTGTPGNTNDGGSALTATLTGPEKLAWRGGFLYVTTPTANRVRMVAPDGMIYRIAGDGSATPPGDGALAGSAPMPAPKAIAVDALGRVILVSRTAAGPSLVYHLR